TILAFMSVAWLCSLTLSYASSPSSDAEQLHKIVNDYSSAFERLDAFQATIYNVEDELSQFGDYPTPQFYAREKALFQTTSTSFMRFTPTKLKEKTKSC